MATDIEVIDRRCTVKVTETVTRGMAFILNSTWPNVVVSTGENVLALGIFLAGGVTGDAVDAYLFGDIVTGYGVATAGALVAPGASGTFVVAGSADRACGVALETKASAAEFKFMALGPCGALVA